MITDWELQELVILARLKEKITALERKPASL